MDARSPLIDAREIARAIGGEVSGANVLAPGPGHSPRDRSLSIRVDRNAPDGFVCHSFAGDDPMVCRDYIAERIGLPKWQPSPKTSDELKIFKEALKRIVATYDYCDEQGTLLFQAVRYEPKDFRQRQPDGNGGWIWSVKDVRKVPYRLPDILAAVHDTVFICEGEKDADSLAMRGFIATSGPQGAGKWTPELNAHFAGKTIYILPDNDEAGRKHAQQVASHLYGIADSVRIVPLPGLAEKGDVSDWIAAGGHTASLVDMGKQVPAWSPEQASEPAPASSTEIAAAPFSWINPLEIPVRRFVYGKHYIRQFLSTTAAPGGVGKSSFGIVEVLAMASGKPLLGVNPERRLKVWLFNGEDPLEELWRRIMAAALHYGLTAKDIDGHMFVNSGRRMPIVIAEQTREGAIIMAPVVDAVKATIAANAIDVMIVDPFVSSHRVGENDNNAIERVAKTWSAIADETNCAIDLVHHTRKTGGAEVTVEDGRGASALLSAARSARVLNAMSEEEAAKAGVENRRVHFRVDNGKANLAPPQDQAEWFKLQNFDLGNGKSGEASDQIGVVTQWHWPNPLDDITVAHLRAAQEAVKAGGPWRENNQASDWVGAPIAEALRIDVSTKSGKQKVSSLLKIWIANGMFVRVVGKDAKRMEKTFIEVGQWATD